MSETENDVELSEQDQADLRLLQEPPAPTHSVLEVWDLILSNAEPQGRLPILSGVASAIVARYPYLKHQETQQYHAYYHHLLQECRELLHAELAGDTKYRQWVGDEDAEHNYAHYKNVLVSWHNFFDALEEEWVAEDETSHIQIAVLSDVRAFFFSGVGLAGHLDSIQFSLSKDEFIEAIQESRGVTGE